MTTLLSKFDDLISEFNTLAIVILDYIVMYPDLLQLLSSAIHPLGTASKPNVHMTFNILQK